MGILLDHTGYVYSVVAFADFEYLAVYIEYDKYPLVRELWYYNNDY